MEGARERAEEGVLVEHIYGKDVNTLWEVLCALEGRPNSEEEVPADKARSGYQGGE